MTCVQVCRQGADSEPVLVVDGLLDDPERLIDDADMLSYRPIGDHYPGVRALVPPRLVSVMVDAVADEIRAAFNVQGRLDRFDAYYSLVTAQPHALAPIQRLPHFDGVERDRLAFLLFLSRQEIGGTAFYRHRSTGFETVNPHRLETYRRALAADIAEHGLPKAEYIAGDTPIFERIAHYQGRFNRALIYRGNTLHCADIPDDLKLSPSARAGRLTVNVFLTTGPSR